MTLDVAVCFDWFVPISGLWLSGTMRWPYYCYCLLFIVIVIAIVNVIVIVISITK